MRETAEYVLTVLIFVPNRCDMILLRAYSELLVGDRQGWQLQRHNILNELSATVSMMIRSSKAISQLGQKCMQPADQDVNFSTIGTLKIWKIEVIDTQFIFRQQTLHLF